MKTVMKKCCGLCPFSKKQTLFLHPSRAEEFAYMAENPYTDFVCHKTGIIDEDHPIEEEQNSISRGEKSLTCAGFHVMQKSINAQDEEIEIDVDYTEHFDDENKMIKHHEEFYLSKRKT